TLEDHDLGMRSRAIAGTVRLLNMPLGRMLNDVLSMEYVGVKSIMIGDVIITVGELFCYVYAYPSLLIKMN
ncbi:hypothetical protein BDU57DRAFT_448319, partial [Ampelomyces quisqualis]